VQWLSTSLDYWTITKKEQIDTISGDALLTDPALLAAYGSRIHRNAAGFITFIDTPVENLGGLRTSGWDLDVKASWPVAAGKFGVQFTGTYISRWERQSGPNAAYVSYLGTAGDGGTVQPKPRWQHTLAFDWQQAELGRDAREHLRQGLDRVGRPGRRQHRRAPGVPVKDTVRWNLSGTYRG
jgi:iron complex outermembrane receptor protein